MRFGVVIAGFLVMMLPQIVVARPVLVELFTSQGCASCPPADEFLGHLAGRHDVLALSYHVDYWDEGGWVDPHSLEASTVRQARYNKENFKRGSNYTPQMVVEGISHETGSAKTKVELLIVRSKRQARNPWRDVKIAFTPTADDKLEVKVGEKGGEYQNRPLDVVAVVYDDKAHTGVTAGENSFRSITNHNIVRAIYPIGEWKGEERVYVLDVKKLEKADNLVVFLQEKSMRNISGLNSYRLNKNEIKAVTASLK